MLEKGRREADEVIRTDYLSLTRDVTRWKLVVFILIVIVGFAVRFDNLSRSDFVVDEVGKIFAIEDYGDGKFWTDLDHPPLEKYLIYLSSSMLGLSEFSVKLPNTIIGSLTPVAVFFVLMLMTRKEDIAILGAILTALSPLMVGYSVIAKEDTLVNFLTVVSLFFLWRAVEQRAMQEGERESGPLPDKWFHRFSPRLLTQDEIIFSIIAGLALSSKFTFIFSLVAWYLIIRLWHPKTVARIFSPILVLILTTFFILGWYYLNPYWLGSGMGHWALESTAGHKTYFLGHTYDYPPPHFYFVVIIGRIAPLIVIGAIIALSGLVHTSKKRTDIKGNTGNLGKGKGKSSLQRVTSRFKCITEQDRYGWFIGFWFLGILLILTLIPFKGVRYIQPMLIPMIFLSAIGIERAFSRIGIRGVRSFTSIVSVTVIMTVLLWNAHPYYLERTYFFSPESGVADFNGQGHKEVFDWMESNGLEGKVSMFFIEEGEYYHSNTTPPVESKREIIEKNVSFIILYNYVVWRDMFPFLTRYAQSENCTLLYTVEHHGVELVWLYRVDRV